MADPIKYSVSYDFSNFQASSPNTPLPGNWVDIELQNIDEAIGQTIDALKDIRRSDGKLQNGLVDADALAANLVDQVIDGAISDAAASAAAALASEQNAAASEDAASTSAAAALASQTAAGLSEAAVLAVEENLPDWRGAWVTATAYDTGDLVRVLGSSYICVVAHTSAADFSTDLSALRWDLFAQEGAAGPGTGDMLAANDLSDLASFATARANLGVPETSTVLLKSGNLSGLADAPTALTNLGLTATAAEINILDGVTATTAEINILDGVTSTAAEINILDGVTATTAEINALDGVTETGTSLISAANSAAGRTALGAPASPDELSVQSIGTGGGAAYVTPSGGRWFVYAEQVRVSGPNTGTYAFVRRAQVYNGNTSIGTPAADFGWVGFAWRLS